MGLKVEGVESGFGKKEVKVGSEKAGRIPPCKNEKKIKKRIKNYEEDSQRQNN